MQVYGMLATFGSFADPNNNSATVLTRAEAVAHNYVNAISPSGVKRVVYLSSIGADLEKDSGLILIHHHAEKDILYTLCPLTYTFHFCVRRFSTKTCSV